MPKSNKKPAGPPPESFFGEYLEGEPPLTLKTANLLIEAAGMMQRIKPWELLEETNLVFFGKREEEPLTVCSVIGALGESFAFFAYVGGTSYFDFRAMHEHRLRPREFFARQHSVRMEFVPSPELTRADRELLRATGSTSRGLRPQLRTIRPHYHSWYPTEFEGQLLLLSLTAFLSLFDANCNLPDYWTDENSYPLVELRKSAERPFELHIIRPPNPELDVDPVEVDTERLRRITSRNHRRGGSLEVDCFHIPTRIGGAKERPMWMRAAAALDSASHVAFATELLQPEDADWEGASEALYKALEAGAPIPNRILVSSPFLEAALRNIVQALEAKLVLRSDLPAVDDFREGMMAHFVGGAPLG
jgi:hypothetical protein